MKALNREGIAGPFGGSWSAGPALGIPVDRARTLGGGAAYPESIGDGRVPRAVQREASAEEVATAST